MLLDLAATRRVLFVGGKGGVGKTAVASATALAQARAGRRVLVVSTDPAHNLGHLWEQPVGDTITPLARDVGDSPVRDGGRGALDGIEIDPLATTEAHLAAVGSTIRRLMPEHLAGEVDKHMQLARDSPGAHESAVLERIAELVELGLREYDLVVFDTAPSGHTARLMALPEIMSAWTEGLLRRRGRSERFGAALRGLDERDSAEAVVGTERSPEPREERDLEIRRILLRRRERFESLRAVLVDERRCAFVIVLAAERLPVLETVELHQQLIRAGVHVGALVVNKRSPSDAGAFLAERRRLEGAHLATLLHSLPDVPLLQVPLLPGDIVGEEALDRFGAVLARAPERPTA